MLWKHHRNAGGRTSGRMRRAPPRATKTTTIQSRNSSPSPCNAPEWMKQREKKLRDIQARKNPKGRGPFQHIIDNISEEPVNNHLTETMKKVKSHTRREIINSWEKQWDEGSTGRALHRIQNQVSRKAAQYNTHREKEVAITRIRMGHCRTNSTMHKLKLHPSGDCEACPGIKEDIDHILLRCPARETLRKELQRQTGEHTDLKNILKSRTCWDIIFTWIKTQEKQGI